MRLRDDEQAPQQRSSNDSTASRTTSAVSRRLIAPKPDVNTDTVVISPSKTRLRRCLSVPSAARVRDIEMMDDRINRGECQHDQQRPPHSATGIGSVSAADRERSGRRTHTDPHGRNHDRGPAPLSFEIKAVLFVESVQRLKTVSTGRTRHRRRHSRGHAALQTTINLIDSQQDRSRRSEMQTAAGPARFLPNNEVVQFRFDRSSRVSNCVWTDRISNHRARETGSRP